jgi:hypothetical protein
MRLNAGERGIIPANQVGYAFEFGVADGGHHHINAPLKKDR